MNLPEIDPNDEIAIDTVVNIINQAKTRLGIRQNLMQLARSREDIASAIKVPMSTLEPPLSRNTEAFLDNTIVCKWYLSPTFMYYKKYIGSSEDESTRYYYFEVIFSQPTVAYPIPQATVSVIFRVEDKRTSPVNLDNAPNMFFRIEGQHTDFDVRYVTLTADWLLAVIKLKIDLFKRIESYNLI